MTRGPFASRRRRSSAVRSIATFVAAIAIVTNAIGAAALGAAVRPAPSGEAVPAAIQTSDVALRVADVESDASIPTYHFRIDVDDTGTPGQAPAECFPATNPDYPVGCDWPSVHNATGGAGGVDNLLTQGDQSLFGEETPLTLPDGKYLVSVVADGVVTSLTADAAAGATTVFVDSTEHFAVGQAVTIGRGDGQDEASVIAVDANTSTITFDPGLGSARDAGEAFIAPLEYKLGGAWFSVPMATADAQTPGQVEVKLVPNPLPLGTLRILVFQDTSTNGQFDPQLEAAAPAGFKAHIADVLGEVTTDWFGNPLCSVYDGPPAGDNVVPGTGGQCIDDDQDGVSEPSDHDGVIEIPNIGPNRYGATVVPPDNQNWVQTTTLEGSHDWDTWVLEGYQGYDPELIVDGGQVPVSQFGFVKPQGFSPACSADCGRLQGEVWSTKSYLPPAGGDTDEAPIVRPWISITDLGLAADQLVWAGRGGTDGSFDIPGVAPGTYSLAMWDAEQNLLLGVTTAVVAPNQTVDIGRFVISHWFSEVHGTVFFDTNSNGKQEAGERGMAGFPVVLKSRDNSLVDAGTKVATTDANGHYEFPQVYPYGYWTVLEAYSDLLYTTGVTYQADNGPETTRMGAGVDVSVLNQDGLNSRIDWGVRSYDSGTNGGIVGSVTYAVTRNELDPRLAATEDYEPGIPGMLVELRKPVACGTHASTPCDASGRYELAADGSLALGQLLNTYITEEFQRPTDCQARDAAGTPFTLPFMAPATGGHECIESPLMGNQIKTGPVERNAPDESDFTLVNGNYGFGDGCYTGTLDATDPAAPECLDGNGDPVDFDPLTPGDYLVKVIGPDDAWNRPKFQVLREEDVNVFGGDQFAPQVPPPPCVGASHIVDVAGIAPDGSLTVADDGPSAVTNPSFAEGGGSPFEGQARPMCDLKLVPVQNGKSIAPSFYYFAEVPPPGRMFGAMVEDLALGTNPKEFYYGEKAGIPTAPVGIYDYAGRPVTTIHTDPNGFFEVLLPSTRTFNCPLPAGPCPNMYRFIGNDPGSPNHPNTDYLPQYRTFESDWQVWPGQTLLADVAIIQNGPVIELPGTQNTHPPSCTVEPNRPELFAVSTPVVTGSGPFSIEGVAFGGGGTISLDGSALPAAAITSWTDTHIDASIPAGWPAGAHQLTITRSDSGLSAVNSLTFHVRGGSYLPTVLEVGPGKTYATIQSALEVATSVSRPLVVVYPRASGQYTPLGDYYESLVIHSSVKLQGVGPGGVRSDGSHVRGSIVNGLGFANANFAAWQALIEGIRAGEGWSGNQAIYEGPVITVVAGDGEFSAGDPAMIDGLTIKGGDEFGYPSTQPTYAVQGGGIYVNAYARGLRITNDVIQSNGGAYGGGIRIGTPAVGDGHNDGIVIRNDRIVANGGSNLAGAIGLFAGSNGYEIDHNDICGNFSAEYGGGISHFGLSSAAGPAARIHDNRIWFNGSYDEGAGIFVGGEPAADPLALSAGSGPVEISANIVQGNLADDDGGGIRLLQAGNWPIPIFNNLIVNNVSAHEGGGVALDDATNVRFFNNTVMKNLTTATAVTSDGQPVPAGLSDTENSDLLQATLPVGHATYSDPLQFNNIFWDNRAGTRVVTASSWDVTGLGRPGDPTPIDLWDMGVVGPGALHPTNSILNDTARSLIVADPSNKRGPTFDPLVRAEYDLSVDFLPWRAGGTFIYDFIVSLDLPPGLLGDYRLEDPATGSSANNAGASSKNGLTAPASDIEGDPRPTGAFEIGADEDTASAADLAGPTVSSVAANPNPTNGTTTLSAAASDVATGNSNINDAEWFKDAVGTDGSGTHFTTGLGAPTASLSTLVATTAWTAGAHSVYVHARDSFGNWGPTASVVLNVDRTGPATGSVAAAPNPTEGATSVTLTANATDVATGGSNIVAAEWFEGADPGVGLATPMTASDSSFNTATEGLTASINVSSWSDGNHTLSIRSKDAAGNWGAVATIVVAKRLTLFSDNFESGNLSAWTSVTRPAGLTVNGSAKHAGTFGMQAVIAGGGTATYVTDGSPNLEASYHARFYFNTTAATTTGNSQHTIFSGFTATNALLYQVQFRHKNGGNKWEFRATFSRPNGEATTDWYTLGNAPANTWHAIEIGWQGAAAGSLSLYLDGVLRQTLTGNTSTYRLDYARLGPSAGVGNNQNGTEYFDDFVSTRSTYIGP